jgi:hypothetical protein
MTTTTFLNLSPPDQLLTKVTNPTTNKTDYAFPLQTKAWLKMQGVAQIALGFPITKETFTNQYGTFPNEQTVLDAIGVLKAINQVLVEYGDPNTLFSGIAGFQAATTAPTSIYGNAVWLSRNTQTTAENIVSYLQEGLKDIGEEPDPVKRLADLTELLTGQGGIIPQATTLKGKISAFSTKTSNFYTTLNSELTGPTKSLQVYLDQDDNVLASAKKIVHDDLENLKKLTKHIHKLNDEYIGFTVAASLSPIFLLIPFYGIILAIADAATFGALAKETKDALDQARRDFKTQGDEEKKKAALVTVLSHFNDSVIPVKKDGDEFLATIATMVAGWTEFSGQILNQLEHLTPEDLKDWSAFLQKVNFQSAVDAWTRIAQKAEDFANAGFIKFNSSN